MSISCLLKCLMFIPLVSCDQLECVVEDCDWIIYFFIILFAGLLYIASFLYCMWLPIWRIKLYIYNGQVAETVLNARVLRGSNKFDHEVCAIAPHELHWLDVLDGVTDNLGVMTSRYVSTRVLNCNTLASPVPRTSRKARPNSKQVHVWVTQGHRRCHHLIQHVWYDVSTDLRVMLDADTFPHDLQRAWVTNRNCPQAYFLVSSENGRSRPTGHRHNRQHLNEDSCNKLNCERLCGFSTAVIRYPPNRPTRRQANSQNGQVDDRYCSDVIH